ncbi:MAG: hypothetical protein QOI54_3330 [Actinomycetota bacterium]|jgi:hypothetical protein|nr:hypothetical protein [Actinomycetota bacterium]
MKRREKKPDPFDILDDPPGSWKPVRTLLFTLIGLVVFLAAMAYMIWQVRSGRAVLPGGVGGG